MNTIVKLLAISGLLSTIGLSALAQGTAFSYQGRLNDGGSPANGIYDLRFTIYDATNGGTSYGALTNAVAGITNGLFSVTLDFGAGVFTGPSRWLEIAARTNGAVSFTTLAPRQSVQPVPYAIMANSASNVLGNVASSQLIGTVALTQLPGTVVTNNGSGLILNGTFNGNNGINNTNQTGANYSFLGGGQNNSIEPYATNSFLGGGDNNSIQMYSTASFLGGGETNSIQKSAYISFLGGGQDNSIQMWAYGSVLVGGFHNSIQTNSNNSFLGAGSGNSIQTNSAFSTLVGGHYNSIQANATNSFLGGGINNTIQAFAYQSFLGGGQNNTLQTYANYCVLGGGHNNSIQAGNNDAFLGGGQNNSIQVGAYGSALVGGQSNAVLTNNYDSFLGGGSHNTNGSSYGFIGGGYANLATNNCATIPGGSNNVAGGQCSFAAGQSAQAVNNNAFVWSDGSATLASTNSQSVTMRASGGYRLFSGSSSGVYVAPGGGSWTSLSDRNVKENFVPVDAGLILEKVAALPLSIWNYKSQDAAIRHIGPMAQDFKATFAVGESETGITTVDESGVALAAIQGLSLKLNEKNAEIEALKQSVAELKQMVQTLAAKK